MSEGKMVLEELVDKLKIAIKLGDIEQIISIREDVIGKHGLGIWLGIYGRLDPHGNKKGRKK